MSQEENNKNNRGQLVISRSLKLLMGKAYMFFYEKHSSPPLPCVGEFNNFLNIFCLTTYWAFTSIVGRGTKREARGCYCVRSQEAAWVWHVWHKSAIVENNCHRAQEHCFRLGFLVIKLVWGAKYFGLCLLPFNCIGGRSEERRVGKECDRLWSLLWWDQRKQAQSKILGTSH